MLGNIAAVKNIIVSFARRIGAAVKRFLDPRDGGAGVVAGAA
jgi:hypothetical protein